MENALGSPIDNRNIALAKILFSLRHDLDIHCLIGVNASKISENAIGKFFFGHLDMRMIESISLAICKVYEKEKKHKLNSIEGVLNSLADHDPRLMVNGKEVQDFVVRYGGPFHVTDPLLAIQKTFYRFRSEYRSELKKFKDARNKIIAHSEFEAPRNPLPSFDTMEKLFLFGADFYALVSESFVRSGAADLNRGEVKRGLEEILRLIGTKDLKLEME